jgi:hypothetical protein
MAILAAIALGNFGGSNGGNFAADPPPPGDRPKIGKSPIRLKSV